MGKAAKWFGWLSFLWRLSKPFHKIKEEPQIDEVIDAVGRKIAEEDAKAKVKPAG